MASVSATVFVQHIRRLAAAHDAERLTDRELLERFTRQRDETAFSALLRRHGPMVLRVCQWLLPQQADAEDVFQAVFLLLARKATGLRDPDSVGNWLYGVAHHLALKAGRAAARRRAHECHAPAHPPADPLAEITLREAQMLFDEALCQLPEDSRAALVLCYLEGLTQEEAARQLGCSRSTLKRRLESGRVLLRERLARRGLTLTGVLLAAVLSPDGAYAVPLGALTRATVKAALACAGKHAATGIVSAKVAALVEGGLKTTFPAKQIAIALVVALGTAAGGAGLIFCQTSAATAPGSYRVQQAGLAGKRGDTFRAAKAKSPRTDRHGDPLPPGAVARLGTVRFRHAGWANGVAYAPDGKLLASIGYDNLVRIWEPDTGKEIRRCVGHTEVPFTLAFSPDGQTLASAGVDKTIRLWDPRTGKEIRHMQCDETVFSIAFTPDGKTLASGGRDKQVHLWDPATGQEVRTLQGHKGAVMSVAFSHDGKHLASGSSGWNQPEESAIFLWEVATGKEVSRFENQKPDITRLLFSPDGKGLIMGSRAGSIHWLDLSTGQVNKEFKGHKGYARALAFSRDGKTLFSGGVQDRTIRVWDIATAKEMRVLGKHRDSVSDIALSPNGKTLASCGENMVRLWDVEAGKEKRLPEGHGVSVITVAFARDGKTVVSGSDDGVVRRWDAATGEALGQFDPDYAVSDGVSTGLFPDGGIAAIVRDGKTVHLWDIVKGKELASPKIGRPSRWPIFSPSGRVLAVLAEGELGWWTCERGRSFASCR